MFLRCAFVVHRSLIPKTKHFGDFADSEWSQKSFIAIRIHVDEWSHGEKVAAPTQTTAAAASTQTTRARCSGSRSSP